MKLKFLGTGGGRYVTGMQRRKTSGIMLETEETQIHVDPGPGALVGSHKQGLAEETSAVIVSHGHIDHSNDAEAVIEMMTEAYDHRGAVFASESVLSGYGEVEKRVSDYHQSLCATVETLEEGSEHEFEDVKIKSQEMFHSDPKTQGFIIETEEKQVGFWTDTEYSKELAEFYDGVDIMVVYCGRPKNESTPSHTSLEKVPDIVEVSGADTVIITHFGFKFLDSDLEEQEQWLEENTDAKVVFASDGMDFPGNRSLGDF